MKLLTKKVTGKNAFQSRLLKLLKSRICATYFASKNPNSVDQRDRVCNVEFLSTPHVKTISDFGPGEALIEGWIKVELVLQSRVHDIDREETVSEECTCNCRFCVVVNGEPRTTADLTTVQIQALDIKIRDISIL